MPTYLHYCEPCDQRLEDTRTIAHALKNHKCPGCGKPMPRDFKAEHTHTTAPSQFKEVRSISLGVNPKDIRAEEAKMRREGIPGRFDKKNGDMLFENVKDRDKAARKLGFHVT